MRIHELKTHPPYFGAVMRGVKMFEIRNNDRDFKVGDGLLLCEYEPDLQRYTGNTVKCHITYIAQGVFGLPEDVCVLSIAADKPKEVTMSDEICECGLLDPDPNNPQFHRNSCPAYRPRPKPDTDGGDADKIVFVPVKSGNEWQVQFGSERTGFKILADHLEDYGTAERYAIAARFGADAILPQLAAEVERREQAEAVIDHYRDAANWAHWRKVGTNESYATRYNPTDLKTFNGYDKAREYLEANKQ